MAFYVNNKKFLNYEEQVIENKTKIKQLETSIGQGLPLQLRVWKEGDRIVDLNRESKFSRTFIVIAGEPTDEQTYVTFRKSNGEFLNDSNGGQIFINNKIFYIHYDKDYMEEGVLYLEYGDAEANHNVGSEIITDFINLSTGTDTKLLEIIA